MKIKRGLLYEVTGPGVVEYAEAEMKEGDWLYIGAECIALFGQDLAVYNWLQTHNVEVYKNVSYFKGVKDDNSNANS